MMNNSKKEVNRNDRKALLWNCNNDIVALLDQEFKKKEIIEMQMDVKLLNIVYAFNVVKYSSLLDKSLYISLLL